MLPPNLNTLKMFDAAARHLNFRLASQELNLTQGAVAQQVRQLENSINTKLFERLPRGLALTDTGHEFHAEIRRALDIIDTATARLVPASHSVTLSVPPSLAAKWLVPRLTDFAKIHPDITLQTHASADVSDFRRDGIDLAIRQGPPPSDESVVSTLLAPINLMAVASPAYIGPTSVPKELGDLAQHQLIEDGHRRWEALFLDNQLQTPARKLSFNQTALAIDAAVNGQGVAIAPQLLIQDALDQGLLRPFWTPPAPVECFTLLHPRSRHPARTKVIKWLLDQSPISQK